MRYYGALSSGNIPRRTSGQLIIHCIDLKLDVVPPGFVILNEKGKRDPNQRLACLILILVF